VIGGSHLGLPEKSALIEKAGTVKEATSAKGSVWFSFVESDDRFMYNSKARNGLTVSRRLNPGVRARIWHEPLEDDHRPGENVLTVFQVEVNGEIVRSYEQVAEAWLDDNAWSPWLLGWFVLSVVYFVAFIYLAKLKSRFADEHGGAPEER
jgi:hypothetical protein